MSEYDIVALRSGRVIGFDEGRMRYGFTMFSGEDEIRMFIADGALGELAARSGLGAERNENFLKLRESIEQIAARMLVDGPLQADPAEPVLIRIEDIDQSDPFAER